MGDDDIALWVMDPERPVDFAAFTPWGTDWIRAKDELPPDDEGVLVIASGRVNQHITLQDAYELGCYVHGEGWILDEFPACETIEVKWWMPLPGPPEETNNADDS